MRVGEGAVGLAGDLQLDAEGQREAGSEATRRLMLSSLEQMLLSVICCGVVVSRPVSQVGDLWQHAFTMMTRFQ